VNRSRARAFTPRRLTACSFVPLAHPIEQEVLEAAEVHEEAGQSSTVAHLFIFPVLEAILAPNGATSFEVWLLL
jgi:hypothetical protein